MQEYSKGNQSLLFSADIQASRLLCNNSLVLSPWVLITTGNRKKQTLSPFIWQFVHPTSEQLCTMVTSLALQNGDFLFSRDVRRPCKPSIESVKKVKEGYHYKFSYDFPILYTVMPIYALYV